MSLVTKCRNPRKGVSVKPGIVPQGGFDLLNYVCAAFQHSSASLSAAFAITFSLVW